MYDFVKGTTQYERRLHFQNTTLSRLDNLLRGTTLTELGGVQPCTRHVFFSKVGDFTWTLGRYARKSPSRLKNDLFQSLNPVQNVKIANTMKNRQKLSFD